MDISFLDEQIRDLCEKRSALIATLGRDMATELERQLADIDAAPTFSEYVALHPEVITDLGNGEFLVTLPSGLRMRVRSGHPKASRLASRLNDPSRMTRLRILSIEGTQQ